MARGRTLADLLLDAVDADEEQRVRRAPRVEQAPRVPGPRLPGVASGPPPRRAQYKPRRGLYQ